MTTTIRCALSVLGALALLTACPASAPEPDVLSLDEASDRYVDAIVAFGCAQTFQCPGTAWGDAPFLARHDDLEDCVDDPDGILRVFLRNQQRDVVQAVEDGRVRFDPERAERCLERMETQRDALLCTGEAIDDDPDCYAMFDGVGVAGDGCTGDSECATGHECVELIDGDRCTGRCRGCPETPCGDGEWCDRREDAYVCKDVSAEGEPCEVDEQCGDESRFLCNVIGGEGTCVGVGSLSEGDPCSDDDVCAFGLACDGNVCVAPRVAQRDETCALTSPIVGFCGPTFACVPTEDGAQACGAPLEEGDPCISLLQCRSGLQCERADMFDPDSGTCLPLREDGDGCSNPFECASGRCQLYGPQLGVCVSSFRCLFE